MSRTWSPQQEAIFGWFQDPSGRMRGLGPATDGQPTHLIVRARAGTGKTTTIIEGVNQAPEGKILVCAFNKKIADELTTRLVNPNAEAKTLHSVGFAAVRKYWDGVRIEKPSRDVKSRKDDLTDRVCGQRVPDAIKKLVTRLHTLAREINPLALNGSELEPLAMAFECEPDEPWQAEGWTVEQIASLAYRALDLAANEKPLKTGIDFADMIFLPVRNGWMTKTHDLVVVDEAQDMTVAQLIIARGSCKGRICVVGDDRQAIYGFRGADSGSLDRLKAELNATELGLTTTYRCGRAIVDLAREIVPDFEAGPANPEGEILGMKPEQLTDAAAPGDFVLSRMNAPLVQTAMSLLRAGKRTKVAGRDIGAGLRALVRRVSKSARSVPEFLDRLAAWEGREVKRALASGNEKKIEAIVDQAGMLQELADGAKSVTEIENRIEALFTDDGLGQAGLITCSSVHRAKGLEADRVFILTETLKNHSTEELNIQYVAITRAKKELVWVGTGAVPARAEMPLAVAMGAL